MNQPLAERMRPTKLSEVIGHAQLLGDAQILRQIVAKKQPVNLIFWGPPGSGKTTLARIIASEMKADFIELSAVNTGKKDVENVIQRARENWAKGHSGWRLDAMQGSGEKHTERYTKYREGASEQLTLQGAKSPGKASGSAGSQGGTAQPTVLFVDEIHRFNKAQQDGFLPHVESGLITLIGATTENPSFEIISPLLSRSRVVVLEPLSKDDIFHILQRALKAEKATKRVSKAALEYLVELSSGDARVALGNLELALSLETKVTPETVKTAAQKRVPGYDKKGEMHYNVISAFIKSMRGSDEKATLYYLARMVNAGEDPKFIARRMVIFASEDIGLAGNGAMSLATAAFQAVERVGMPESNYILFHTALALARSKKSREATDKMNDAFQLAAQYPDAQVPLHLRNAPTKLMRDLGYGKGTGADSNMPSEVKKDDYLSEKLEA